MSLFPLRFSLLCVSVGSTVCRSSSWTYYIYLPSPCSTRTLVCCKDGDVPRVLICMTDVTRFPVVEWNGMNEPKESHAERISTIQNHDTTTRRIQEIKMICVLERFLFEFYVMKKNKQEPSDWGDSFENSLITDTRPKADSLNVL